MMEWKNWTPNDEILGTVQQVLHDAMVPNSEIQKEVQQKLNFMQTHPDFVNYLLYILSKNDLFSEDVRALSGIILKNNIDATFDSLSDETKGNIKQTSISLLRDPLKEVRSSVCNLVIVIACKDNISAWPELLTYLTSSVDDPDEPMNEITVTTLFRICDEYLIKRDNTGTERNDSLALPVKKFISLLPRGTCNYRKDILRLINQSMENNYYAMRSIMDVKQYIECLLELFCVDDPDIQKYVCQAFVICMEYRESIILMYVPQIIPYILEKTKHENIDVALQASEFWLTTAKLPNCCDVLQSYLDHLVPILLQNMKYSEQELNILKDSLGNDADLQDKVNEIRPYTGYRTGEQDDEYAYVDDETYGTNELLDDPHIGWTLRKCSAASLDALSLQFQSAMVVIVFPHLNGALNHEDVLIKEAAILALGAIADGCVKSMHAIMPQIIAHLLTLMNDQYSIIRVITCWSLSRYVGWVVHVNEPMDEYFIPVMTALVSRFLDNNKRVQRAAISAFCIFQEEACLKLVPFIDFIIRAFVQSFSKLQYRSHMLLYDAIGVFAHSVDGHLNKPDYISVLMPPLMEKFHEFVNYQDEQFLALMECLSNVAQALEVGFLPYTEVVYIRCLLIIQETIAAATQFDEHPDENEIPEKEPMIVALDVILSLAVSLKSCFVKYVTNSNLLILLHAAMQDAVVRVRTPAIALFGELVKLCYPFLSANINEFIPIVIKNLDKSNDLACNNAAWVIGKLCMAMGVAFQPYIHEILDCYSIIMENPIGTKAMHQTVAISVCTLGLVFPEVLAPVLNYVLIPCCIAMRNVSDCEEKEIAFRGLCMMIAYNPNPLTNDFIYFCDAVASFNEVKPDLRDTIRNILTSFKARVGEESWNIYYTQFPPLLKMRLGKLYDI